MHCLYLTVIPAVNLDTAAALEEGSDIGISGRFSPQLISLQIGVVRGVDEVVRERLCHVLVHCLMLWVNGRVVLATEKAAKSRGVCSSVCVCGGGGMG